MTDSARPPEEPMAGGILGFIEGVGGTLLWLLIGSSAWRQAQQGLIMRVVVF